MRHSRRGNETKESEVTMNLYSRSIKRATGFLPFLFTGFLLTGCSQTPPPGPSQAAQAPSQQAAPPPMTSMQPSQAAAAGGQYEEPPVINPADLLSPSAVSRPGLSLQPQVP